MTIKQLSSAIFNDVVGGLAGYSETINISLEQLEDEVVETRLYLIKQYSLKNMLPVKDLMHSINCIELDCKSLDKCPCGKDSEYDEDALHFEIPQIINDFGGDAVEYIGATNKQLKFKVYTSLNFKNHKYKTRGANRPYVYIDTTPNQNNRYDCYVFNAPMLERLSVIAVFKDPRDLEEYMEEQGCCSYIESDNMTWLDAEIKQTLTAKKLQYYRQLYPQPQPNNQVPK